MSTFGKLFRVTTYGESHCKGVGAIIDGVPPGMELTENDIQPQLSRRRPGQNKLTTPVEYNRQVFTQLDTNKLCCSVTKRTRSPSCQVLNSV